MELVVHSHKQKKREKQFDEDRKEKLETLQQEATGNPAAPLYNKEEKLSFYFFLIKL